MASCRPFYVYSPFPLPAAFITADLLSAGIGFFYFVCKVLDSVRCPADVTERHLAASWSS